MLERERERREDCNRGRERQTDGWGGGAREGKRQNGGV